MSTILAVGIATLDIINSVKEYPHEDDEVRAISQRVCRGGNATNTLVVLSQLGHCCHWAGVLVNEIDAQHIEADLSKYHINTDAVTQLTHGKVPTSYITHNLSNGSRTIVHYRDLPEYSFADFQQINLSQFDWLHFEGRNIEETKQMIIWAKQHAPDLPISVEIEKEREQIEQLFTHANWLFFSKPFATGRGFQDAVSFLEQTQALAPQANLSCTWGEAGAWLFAQKQIYHSTSFPPAEIIDTLGAGDTFNAGMIDQLSQRIPPETALINACKLAGRKCGVRGFEIFTAK